MDFQLFYGNFLLQNILRPFQSGSKLQIGKHKICQVTLLNITCFTFVVVMLLLLLLWLFFQVIGTIHTKPKRVKCLEI